MASLSISQDVHQISKDHWITPNQQLLTFSKPLIHEILNARDEQVQQSIWKKESFDPAIVDIVAEYAFDSLSKQFTNWHTALERLNVLPQKIPPLPANIIQALERDYTDTHFLTLVPEELGSINKFVEEVIVPYGKQSDPANANPLQIRSFWDVARQEHGEGPSEPTHWVLMTKGGLFDKNQSYEDQLQKIRELSSRSFANYEYPSLRDTIASIFFYQIATGERLFSDGSYTRVKEKTRNYHLVVGAFTSAGLDVDGLNFSSNGIRVAPVQKFY